MATIRLDSDERRKMIVAAAAGISEALLFRHFPSKKHLYTEILRLGCEGDPALERLATLAPSTETLVRMITFMVRYFLLGGVDGGELDTRLRLVLHSFLEDGEYARELFETIFERVHPLFVASVAAAAAAGDLKDEPIASANRFWFGHHVAAMVAFVSLPGRASVPYQGSLTGLVEEASWFALRGIGMRDAAIASALAAAGQCTAGQFQLQLTTTS